MSKFKSDSAVRGALAPSDIVPGAMAVKKFSGVARTASLGTDLGKQGMKTSLKTQTQSGIQKVNDLAITAGKQAASRLKSAGAVVKERALEVPPKLANGAIEAGRVVDKTVENFGNLFRSKNSSHEFAFVGDVGKQTTTKPRSVEDTVRDKLSNIKWLNIEGKGVAAKGTGKNVHRSEIDEVIKNDYDINGNLVNRSMVPKGYESVEDFLKVVDNTTIKEFGYDSIEEFKAVVGHVDDYLNASPKNNIVNKGLAGGKHVKGVDYDVLGFPIFKGDDVKFSFKLDENLYIATDNRQFTECTKKLKAAIDQGEIPKDIFTPKQLKMIELELPRILNLTWHHHQVPGKMQLVISDKHSVNHLGGNKLWGGGIR